MTDLHLIAPTCGLSATSLVSQIPHKRRGNAASFVPKTMA